MYIKVYSLYKLYHYCTCYKTMLQHYRIEDQDGAKEWSTSKREYNTL